MAILSKSTFVRSCKCLKSLYLYKNFYDLRDEVSASQQAIFDQGHLVGELAQQLFPEGVDASIEPRYDYKQSIVKTTELINDGCKVIYEAGFMYNNLYAALDILVIKNDGCYIYEVKSATSIKEYNIFDISAQYYILTGLGYKVKEVSIVYINNKYERKGEIEPKKLFTIESVLKQAKEHQPFVEAQLKEAQATLRRKTIPEIAVGDHCSKFYSCDYHSYCWKDIDEVEYPVTDISRLGIKATKLIDAGIVSQLDIPDDFPLTKIQRLQVDAVQKKSVTFNKKEVTKFLAQITHPVYFFDFETFRSAVPLFDYSRPYQQIPFQYSLHKRKSKNSSVEHIAFLGDGITDPRKALTEKLISELGTKGSILCYNKSFEISRLKDLAKLFPKHKERIANIIDRIVDLIEPFQKQHVYHWEMNGSASIKSVLPAFIPNLSYGDLEIQEGETASQSYLNMSVESDKDIIESTRTSLLEYCKLDTYAMVELLRFLENGILK